MWSCECHETDGRATTKKQRQPAPLMEVLPARGSDLQTPNCSSDSDDTPRQTPVPGALSQERSRELLSRIAFLEAEAEKLIEHSRRCRSHADEMQSLLARLDAQKAALERLLLGDEAGSLASPELDAWVEPCELTEQTARAYLLWLRRLLHELSEAVDQPATAAPLQPRPSGSLTGRRRRDAPVRIFPGLEALDIAAVVNDSEVTYRPVAAGGGLRKLQPQQQGESSSSWLTLPRQTLYCIAGDAREIAVLGLGGELLTRTRLEAEESPPPPSTNLERINYLRASGRLLLSDFHSLHLCNQCCRVLRSLSTFSWIVGHCVDEANGRLFIVDRVNEFVSVYGLEGLEERGRLTCGEFTDGISSICLLEQRLFVSDRGANAIFVFNADSLELEFRTQMRSPLFVTTDWVSRVYVTVGGRDNTVKILDSRGQLRRKLSGGRGSQPGQFGSPGGLTVALDGSELFVCDLDNRRIQVFRL